MTMDALQRLIENCVQLGVAKTLRDLGITAGEMSETKAARTYGEVFRAAVRDGKLRPCRVGDGRNGTHWYKVTDILAYKAQREVPAEIQWELYDRKHNKNGKVI